MTFLPNGNSWKKLKLAIKFTEHRTIFLPGRDTETAVLATTSIMKTTEQVVDS